MRSRWDQGLRWSHSWPSTCRRAAAEATSTSRARRAVERAKAGEQPFPVSAQPVWTSGSEPWVDLSVRVLRLDSDSGLLHFRLGPNRKEIGDAACRRQASAKGGAGRASRSGWRRACGALDRRGGAGALLHLDLELHGDRSFPSGRRDDSQDLRAGTRRSQILRGSRRRASSRCARFPAHRRPVFVAPTEEVAIHFASLGRSCLLVREVS